MIQADNIDHVICLSSCRVTVIDVGRVGQRTMALFNLPRIARCNIEGSAVKFATPARHVTSSCCQGEGVPKPFAWDRVITVDAGRVTHPSVTRSFMEFLPRADGSAGRR